MIRHKPTGTYSTGGTSPTFTTKGKVWNSLGALKNHLNLATDSYWTPKHIGLRSEFRKYADCEVVTFEVVQNEKVAPFVLSEYLTNKIVERKNERLEKANVNLWPHRQNYFPLMVTYLDGTVEVIDPNDSLNDNSIPND
jgi:hypothetical protein